MLTYSFGGADALLVKSDRFSKSQSNLERNRKERLKMMFGGKVYEIATKSAEYALGLKL